MDLQEAIQVINTTRRGVTDPPLVMAAVCDRCKEGFAMLPQDYSRAKVHDLGMFCRFCNVERRREKRRVSNK